MRIQAHDRAGLINRIAALVPLPRTHRHLYYGVLTPNSPFRAAVTVMAQQTPSQPIKVPAEPAAAGCDVLGFILGNSVPT